MFLYSFPPFPVLKSYDMILGIFLKIRIYIMTIRKLVRKITIPATALEQDSNSDKITIKRNVTIVDRPNIQYIIEETIV